MSDPVRDAAAVEELRARGWSLSSRRDRWAVLDESGGKLAVADDPATAVEQAVAAATEAEAHHQERRARRLLQELGRGRWYVKPRRVTVDGEPAIVWDVHDARTDEVLSADHGGVVAALISGAKDG